MPTLDGQERREFIKQAAIEAFAALTNLNPNQTIESVCAHATNCAVQLAKEVESALHAEGL